MSYYQIKVGDYIGFKRIIYKLPKLNHKELQEQCTPIKTKEKTFVREVLAVQGDYLHVKIAPRQLIAINSRDITGLIRV